MSVSVSSTTKILHMGTRCASDCGLAIYIKKYVKAKEEELCKLKYITMPKYNLKKNLLKETQKAFKIL
jgi:hypothetical protein